jgi:glyoxylase I family protein
MNHFLGLHHIAIICSDYAKSKHFYVNLLGFTVLNEVYREEKKSYKLDLALNGIYLIELFSFPNPPQRITQPEACGLRHLAFSVKDIEKTVKDLKEKEITCEAIRIDAITGKKFTFFFDPDQLQIEIYENQM